MNGKKSCWNRLVGTYCLLAVSVAPWPRLPIVPLGGLPHASAPGDVSDLRRAGSWKPLGRTDARLRRWSAQLRRDADGALRGRIVLVGSPLAPAGDLSAEVAGDSVRGRITDREGVVIARFEGTISEARLRGTYTDLTGETGTWEWDPGRRP